MCERCGERPDTISYVLLSGCWVRQCGTCPKPKDVVATYLDPARKP